MGIEMAFFAQGTTFSLNSVVVAELTKIDGPACKRDDVDVTSHDSSMWKEFLPGLIEAGEIDCEGNYVPSDEGLAEVIDAVSNGLTLVPFSVQTPQGYGFSGNGMITSFKVSLPYDDKAEVSFTLKISGELTFDTTGS
jgi:predicted secreted protein